MPMVQRDVVLTGQDKAGNITMDFPVTRLDLVEGGEAEIRKAPEDGDYLPIIGADGKMKKVPFEALQKTVNSGQSVENLGAVPAERTVNGKELSEDIKLTAEDVGALAKDWKPDLEDLNAALTGRTINGKSLDDDITLTAEDLGIKIFHAGATAPSDTGLLWIDTTATTGGLKYHNGTAWVPVPVSTT